MKVLLAVIAAFRSLFPMGGQAESAKVPSITAAASIRLVERGAVLAEDFEGRNLDRTRWRVWQENPDRTTVRQEDGRLNLTARGPIGHNGLWGLTTAKYKDVVLLDGKPLGAPLQIECRGVKGLYPDDVYEVLVQ